MIFNNLNNGMILNEFELYLNSRVKSSLYVKGVLVNVKSFFNKYDYLDKSSYEKFIYEHSYKKRNRVAYYAILKFAKWYHYNNNNTLKNDILQVIKLMKPDTKDVLKENENLTLQELKIIVNNLSNHRHRLIAWIQAVTGARIREVLSLSKHSYSNDTDIKYQIVNDEVCMIIRFTKTKGGNKIRTVPIYDKELQKEIEEYLMDTYIDNKYLFCSRDVVSKKNRNDDDKVLDRNYYLYYEDLKQTCIKFGINRNKFSTHTFRHNFAMRGYDLSDKDIVAVKELMGHSDIRTTERYLNKAKENTNKLFKLVQE